MKKIPSGIFFSAMIFLMTKLEKTAIVLQSLFNFADVMYRMFVSVYLYIYTNSLVKMTIYTLIRMTVIPFFIYLGGKINKKHSLTFTFGFGLLFQALSLVYALTATPLFEINTNYVYFAAILMGIGEGLYYFSANVMGQVVTTTSRRANYLSFLGFFKNGAALLAPFVANRLIAHSSSDLIAYRKILALLSVLFFVITIISLGINTKAKNPEINIKKSLDLKNKEWRDQLVATALYAVRESLNWSVVSILVSNLAGSGSTYSTAQTCFSVLAVVCFLTLAKNLKREKIGKTFGFGCILNMTSIIVLVLMENMVGVIIYGLCNALSAVFYDNSYSLLYANVLEKYQDDLNGRVISKEIAFYCGRLPAALFIVLCYYIFPENIYYKIPIILYSLMPFLVYKIMMRYNNN